MRIKDNPEFTPKPGEWDPSEEELSSLASDEAKKTTAIETEEGGVSIG